MFSKIAESLQLFLGVISKNFNKGDSRCTVRKWVGPIYSHAHTFEDGGIVIQSNCDII